MTLGKFELEQKLKQDIELVKTGVLRDENPLDLSEEFDELQQACRRGDLKRVQQLISAGVNVNGKDRFDYTPLIIASLCGHYELVELLLECGASAERDTFQGERCIYNALNNKIRKLLLQYDYSKSTDPLQPWAAHISSLLTRSLPKTSDLTIEESSDAFKLHKFILAARSPYFQKKLSEAPETPSWKLPQSIPFESFSVVLRFLYLSNLPRDVVNPRSHRTEEEVLTGVDKISKQLEIPQLWESMLSVNDRRLARQRHQDEVNRANQQIEKFYREKVLGHKMVVDNRKVKDVKWPHGNSIFADCLLRAAEGEDDDDDEEEEDAGVTQPNGIPVGPTSDAGQPKNGSVEPKKSVLYPVHKAMLIRSPYFETMFSSQFAEAQASDHLRIIRVDCAPEVLEVILNFLYTERVDCPLELGIDLLYASDMLLLDKLKSKAALAISSLGSGNQNLLVDRTRDAYGERPPEEEMMEPINVYDVIRAAWDLDVQKLEEFTARYLAYRLEDYIDEPEFVELVRESAARLKNREANDTIELLDDIRYYVGQRFRLRFEDAGLDEMMGEEEEEEQARIAAANADLDAANGVAQPVKEGADAVKGEGRTLAEKEAPPTQDTKSGNGSAAADGGFQTLDGNMAEDEFAADAINYELLVKKIDELVDQLSLEPADQVT
ncbi:BTB/POZ domain-containing protein [Xylariomycetidae sp. FL0641]|nr:BTB/POZ domain-containing protein [Xylariomycetidae sp. FL0641]